MKQLAEYIMEVVIPTLEYQKGSTDEFMDWEVWTPNDDLTTDDCKKICDAFFKKYPANHNDCGEINGIQVKPEWKNGNEWVDFTFFWGDAPRKDRVKVIDDLVNLLTNTIYSTRGSKREIGYLLNKMTW